jgi:hypothetical protein
VNPYSTLLHYAHHRDDASLDRLVEIHGRDFTAASRLALYFGLITGCGFGLFAVPVLWRLGALGAAIALGWIALVAMLNVVDRWRRRRATRRSLIEAKPIVCRKVRIGAIAPGADMFQSYWKRSPDDPGELELDHPLSMLETVERSDEVWQWLMSVPHHNSNRLAPDWLNAHYDIGLVRRRADGTPELVAGGQVYFSYDPWADRVEKW